MPLSGATSSRWPAIRWAGSTAQVQLCFAPKLCAVTAASFRPISPQKWFVHLSAELPRFTHLEHVLFNTAPPPTPLPLRRACNNASSTDANPLDYPLGAPLAGTPGSQLPPGAPLAGTPLLLSSPLQHSPAPGQDPPRSGTCPYKLLTAGYELKCPNSAQRSGAEFGV